MHGLVGKQLEVLKHAADIPTKVRYLPTTKLIQLPARHKNPPTVRIQFLDEESDERGFPCTRCPNKEDEFSFLDVQIHGLEPDGVGRIELGHVLKTNHRFSDPFVIRTVSILPTMLRFLGEGMRSYRCYANLPLA